jgi:hypothetical protein
MVSVHTSTGMIIVGADLYKVLDLQSLATVWVTPCTKTTTAVTNRILVPQNYNGELQINFLPLFWFSYCYGSLIVLDNKAAASIKGVPRIMKRLNEMEEVCRGKFFLKV